MKRTSTFMTCFVVPLLIQGIAFSAAEAPAPTASLVEAARLGNVDEIRRHIAAGANVNAPDARRTVPLNAAIFAGSLDAVTVLVEAGANPALDGPQRAPFINAIGLGNLEMVRIFVTRSHVDVNAEIGGTTPLAAARRQPEIAAYLREQGAVEPILADGGVYGDMGAPGPGSGPFNPRLGAGPSAGAPQILADPNAIRAQIRAIAGLEESLKVIDANAMNEARSWRQRNVDNRTGLIRAVEKQFQDEMHFVRATATKEAVPAPALSRLAASIASLSQGTPAPGQTHVADANAPGIVAAIDDLVARRTQRYDVISEELREQRRIALQEEREAASNTRGRGRSSRGRSSRETGSAYQNTPPQSPTRTARLGQEPDEPVLDPDTQSQLTAWLGANPEDKRDLLATVHEMDLMEYDALHQVALQAQAPKTATTLAGLMLARQERLDAILTKMAADDDRLQRLQERTGDSQQDPTTSRRGRRSR